MNITTEYLAHHDKYSKLYKKCVVLMQVGSFYEVYATDERGPDIVSIANLLNITQTQKDKSNPIISEKNSYLIGFPKVSELKYINVLIENLYTVIMVEQISPPPHPRREVTNIFSAGTVISEHPKPDHNFIVCIFSQHEKQRQGNPVECIGMTAIDISTGQVRVHEAISTQSDPSFAMDSALHFLRVLKPVEIITNVSLPSPSGIIHLRKEMNEYTSI